MCVGGGGGGGTNFKEHNGLISNSLRRLYTFACTTAAVWTTRHALIEEIMDYSCLAEMLFTYISFGQKSIISSTLSEVIFA